MRCVIGLMSTRCPRPPLVPPELPPPPSITVVPRPRGARRRPRAAWTARGARCRAAARSPSGDVRLLRGLRARQQGPLRSPGRRRGPEYAAAWQTAPNRAVSHGRILGGPGTGAADAGWCRSWPSACFPFLPSSAQIVPHWSLAALSPVSELPQPGPGARGVNTLIPLYSAPHRDPPAADNPAGSSPGAAGR